MSLALVVLLLQQPASAGTAPHGPAPGPRAAVAGLTGFESVSRLDFGAQQNRLTAVYVFPDRVRWHFESYGAVQRSEHQYFYRYGETVRELVAGRPSHAIEGAERAAVLSQMELRRAAMLWPDGFAWVSHDDCTRSADVSADSCCGGEPLGRLVATLENGRPRRIEARDTEDRVIEALEIRAWQELGGRTWPRTLAVRPESGGFVETIESVETRVHFIELSFVPADLRPPPEWKGAGPAVRSHDIVAMTHASRALPADVGWDEALARARRWIAEEGEALKALGLAVEPVPTFELSADGRPVRCLLRLTTAAVPPPPGYETQTDRVGSFLALQELSSVDSSLIARLSRSAPEGARPGTPYLRLHERAKLPIELVLPFLPVE